MTIFLITSPSGAGKTFLSQRIASYGDWVECISTTTRPMRRGEVDGKTYYFVSKDTFEYKVSKGEFAEEVEYDGNLYGITKDEIERVLSKNKNVFIIVEFEGYKQVKAQYPDAVGIFLYMKKEDCMINMLHRGDSIEKANDRIITYDNEMKNREEYDYVIKNVRDRHVETISILRNIISQHSPITTTYGVR